MMSLFSVSLRQGRIFLFQRIENARSQPFIHNVICVSAYDAWAFHAIRTTPALEPVYFMVEFIRERLRPFAQFFAQVFGKNFL